MGRAGVNPGEGLKVEEKEEEEEEEQEKPRMNTDEHG